MSILLTILIVVTSLVLSIYFVLRDAKKFAIKPPTPLVDLDRMYDVIFDRLDDATGASITPKELFEILDSFIRVLGENNLILENLAESQESQVQTTLEYGAFLNHIKANKPNLEVSEESILKVIDLSFAYLGEINAVT